MDNPETAGLREVLTLLTDALAGADRANEALLGAKIEEALECAREAMAHAG